MKSSKSTAVKCEMRMIRPNSYLLITSAPSALDPAGGSTPETRVAWQ